MVAARGVVVEILDFGVSAEGTCYLVMELLYGEDLHTTLRRERRLPLRRAANILLQICAGLGAAHEAGIVHRDLKPGNFRAAGCRGVGDCIKLVAFGTAKRLPGEDNSADPPLTTAGSVLGTIFYMPPEQASGGQIDHRADVYAAGVLFYQLVCGHLPFRGLVAEHGSQRSGDRGSVVLPDHHHDLYAYCDRCGRMLLEPPVHRA